MWSPHLCTMSPMGHHLCTHIWEDTAEGCVGLPGLGGCSGFNGNPEVGQHSSNSSTLQAGGGEELWSRLKEGLGPSWTWSFTSSVFLHPIPPIPLLSLPPNTRNGKTRDFWPATQWGPAPTLLYVLYGTFAALVLEPSGLGFQSDRTYTLWTEYTPWTEYTLWTKKGIF